MEVTEPTQRRALPVHLARDHDPKPLSERFQPPCATIKRLVMKPAQRQPVVHPVRPSRCVPFDVGRLQAKQLVAEADVVVAHGTAALVRAQYRRTEVGVAGPTPARLVRPTPRRNPTAPRMSSWSDSGKWACSRSWAAFANSSASPSNSRWTVSGSPPSTASRISGFFAKVAGRSPRYSVGRRDLPKAVLAQEREGIGRVLYLARPPETSQEDGQGALDLLEWREPPLATLQAPQREQQQQRLVRRPLATRAPDVELPNPPQEVPSIHGRNLDSGCSPAASRHRSVSSRPFHGRERPEAARTPHGSHQTRRLVLHRRHVRSRGGGGRAAHRGARLQRPVAAGNPRPEPLCARRVAAGQHERTRRRDRDRVDLPPRAGG